MGTCGTMQGGKRRKSRKTRRIRGGAYGFGAPITVGALEVGKVDTATPYSSTSGQRVADPFGTSPDSNAKVTGGRRRKTRKGKSKKGGRRSRKMKGGAFSPGNVNAAGTGYGFTGPTDGVRGGIAPASGYASRVGGAPMGADGVRSV